MSRSPHPRRSHRVRKAFQPRDGILIEGQLASGTPPRCPCCGELLEARRSRSCGRFPLDATGYDLECRDCRRFWCVVRHTRRSIRLLRMRRFAAALRATPVGRPEPMQPGRPVATGQASTPA